MVMGLELVQRGGNRLQQVTSAGEIPDLTGRQQHGVNRSGIDDSGDQSAGDPTTFSR
jgi:hypothetical protein